MRSSSIARTSRSASSKASLCALDLGLAAARLGGVVRGAEQRDQRGGRVGRAAQRIDHRGEAVGDAGLAQIAEPGAQPHHGVRLEPGEQHQLVEFVILGLARQHLGDRRLDRRRRARARRRHRRCRAVRGGNRGYGPCRRRGVVGFSSMHAEAEMLEHRDRFAERDQPGAAIGLQVEVGALVARARGTGGRCARRLRRARSGGGCPRPRHRPVTRAR